MPNYRLAPMSAAIDMLHPDTIYIQKKAASSDLNYWLINTEGGLEIGAISLHVLGLGDEAHAEELAFEFFIDYLPIITNILLIRGSIHAVVPTIFRVADVRVGLSVNYFDDPADSASVFLCLQWFLKKDQTAAAGGAGGYTIGVNCSVHIDDHDWHLGVLNTDTINNQFPIKVAKAALAHDSGIKIKLNEELFTVEPKDFIPAPNALQLQVIEAYVHHMPEELTVPEIPAEMPKECLASALRALTTYQEMLDAHSKEFIRKQLIFLDKKLICIECYDLCATYWAKPELHEEEVPLMDYFSEALARGDLRTPYIENVNFLRATVELYTNGSWEGMPERILTPRKFTSILEPSNKTQKPHRKYLLARSSLRTSLLISGEEVVSPAPLVIAPLTKDLDFVAAPPTLLVRSASWDRESVVMALNADYLLQSLGVINLDFPLPDILSQVLEMTNSRMCFDNLECLGLASISTDSLLDISQCLFKRTGLARHVTLFTAGVLRALAQQLTRCTPTHSFSVQYFSEPDSTLIAHGYIVFTVNDGSAIKRYLVDPTQEVVEDISTEIKFLRCVDDYGKRKAYWFLRPLAAEYGFTHPNTYDDKPLGKIPLLKLQYLALTNEAIMDELKELGLVAPDSNQIVLTEENKATTWGLARKYQCFFSEGMRRPEILALQKQFIEQLIALGFTPSSTLIAPREQVTAFNDAGAGSIVEESDYYRLFSRPAAGAAGGAGMALTAESTVVPGPG